MPDLEDQPGYPDTADFDDGDHLDSLDQACPQDGYSPPADPDAEPETGEPA